MKSQNKSLNIAIVSTYPPRECGIATYTRNLILAVKEVQPHTRFSIATLNDAKYKYPKIVRYIINQNNDDDYKRAAEAINQSPIDIVSIQHEFGIFGGFNGNKILIFLKYIKKPVVLTLHTVSIYQEKPYKIIPKRYKSRNKLCRKIFDNVDAITVMTQAARSYLIKNFQLSKSKVFLIPHGAPILNPNTIKGYQQKKITLGFNKNDFIITSFGLITPKKGLEYVIKALPAVIRNNPNNSIKYLIAGKVHPQKPKSYLINLKKIVKKNKLEKNIIFDERYLSYVEIYKYLVNSDIYATPYYVKEQASSGTLSYALAAGCCIVSTPYIFALDVINNHQVGELIKFKDYNSIIEVFNKLIQNQNLIKKYKKNSYQFGKSIYWPQIGQKFFNLFNYIIINRNKDVYAKRL